MLHDDLFSHIIEAEYFPTLFEYAALLLGSKDSTIDSRCNFHNLGLLFTFSMQQWSEN